MRRRRGRGLLNSVINRLPIELHIPGYRFCGPGTKLQKRLERGDVGRNPLDEACKQHDIAYSRSTDLGSRHIADRQLAEEAFKRTGARDASLGEKLAAAAVGSAMKAKVKLGMGCRKKRRSRRRRKPITVKGGKLPFKTLIRSAWKKIRNVPPGNLIKAAKMALTPMKKLSRQVRFPPRVIPVPKTGGILPLIPIFAALSALGALSGGAAGIAKAVNDAKAGQHQLEESQRHNKTMEAIALGKGLALKRHRRGFGLYVWPRPNSGQGFKKRRNLYKKKLRIKRRKS